MRWVLVVLVLASCAPPPVDLCGECTADIDCDRGLACDSVVHLCKPPAAFVHREYVANPPPPTCGNVDCVETYACKEVGACTALAGVCTPADDADCRKSKTCTDYGNCSLASDHTCKALTDEDCRRCFSCVEQGYTLASGGKCRFQLPP